MVLFLILVVDSLINVLDKSTTLTGRTIVKHMSAEVNNVITGEYDHVGKAMIYGDTDSCYFSAWPMLKDDVDSR